MAFVVLPNTTAVLFSKYSDMNTVGIPITVRIHDQGNGSIAQLAQSHTRVSLVHMYAGAKSSPRERAISVTAMVKVMIPIGNFNSRYVMPVQVALFVRCILTRGHNPWGVG